MRDESNPRLQCNKCGKWRRLNDSEGNQLMFPFYGNPPNYNEPEVFDNLCVWCHKEYGVILAPLKE